MNANTENNKYTILVDLILRKTDETSLKSAEITYVAKESTYCEETVAIEETMAIPSNGFAIGLSVSIGGLLIKLVAADTLV